MPQEPGQLIASKYRLERPLARGGMGEVWVARHVELEVEVALKFSRVGEDFDNQSEQRFKREAQAAAKLKSPHIVQIHDYGVYEGTPYIAMELLAGEDLGALLDRVGSLPLARALDWLGQAAKALGAVHKAGVVHRDIKPSNLFLAEDHGETLLKMLDFGIAKTPRESGQTTSAGLLLGSPAYMSPEQARGNPVDARSDLWSLGAVFYRMLTGTAPFEGSNSGDVLVRLCTEEVTPPSDLAPQWGPEVDAFFFRALARDPNRRFASIAEFLAAASALPCPADEADEAQALSAPVPVRGRTSVTASLGQAPVASSPRTEVSPSAAPGLDRVDVTQASPASGGNPSLGARGLAIAGGALLLIGAALLWTSSRAGSHAEPSEPAGHPTETPAQDPWQAEPEVAAQLTTTHLEPAKAQDIEGAAATAADEPDTGAEQAAPPHTPIPAARKPVPRAAPLRPARDRAASEPRPNAEHLEAPERPTRADPVFGLPLDERP